MEREYGHFVVRCLAAALMLAVLCCDLAGVTDEHPQDDEAEDDNGGYQEPDWLVESQIAVFFVCKTGEYHDYFGGMPFGSNFYGLFKYVLDTQGFDHLATYEVDAYSDWDTLEEPFTMNGRLFGVDADWDIEKFTLTETMLYRDQAVFRTYTNWTALPSSFAYLSGNIYVRETDLRGFKPYTGDFVKIDSSGKRNVLLDDSHAENIGRLFSNGRRLFTLLYVDSQSNRLILRERNPETALISGTIFDVHLPDGIDGADLYYDGFEMDEDWLYVFDSCLSNGYAYLSMYEFGTDSWLSLYFTPGESEGYVRIEDADRGLLMFKEKLPSMDEHRYYVLDLRTAKTNEIDILRNVVCRYGPELLVARDPVLMR